MNDRQRKKRNFRASKKWLEFRKIIYSLQKGKDIITKRKLLKGANLHHLNLNPDEYNNLSKTENFVYVNKKTHDFIHWLYPYFVKDCCVLKRLAELLLQMKNINGD